MSLLKMQRTNRFFSDYYQIPLNVHDEMFLVGKKSEVFYMVVTEQGSLTDGGRKYIDSAEAGRRAEQLALQNRGAYYVMKSITKSVIPSVVTTSLG